MGIRICAAARPEAEPSARCGKGSRCMDSTRTLRLVVADDHRLLHSVYQEVLEPEGFSIAAFARRGSELLPLVHRHAPDAVLLELDLPELDGIAAIRRLAKQFPDIPAI